MVRARKCSKSAAEIFDLENMCHLVQDTMVRRSRVALALTVLHQTAFAVRNLDRDGKIGLTIRVTDESWRLSRPLGPAKGLDKNVT